MPKDRFSEQEIYVADSAIVANMYIMYVWLCVDILLWCLSHTDNSDIIYTHSIMFCGQQQTIVGAHALTNKHCVEYLDFR